MRHFSITFIITMFLAFVSCKKSAQNSEKPKQDSTNTELSKEEQKSIEEQMESVPLPPDYKNLILGRWELEGDSDRWLYYEKDKVYSDGNQQGTGYKVDIGELIYDNGSRIHILDINEKEMIIQVNGQNQTWKKADKKN